MKKLVAVNKCQLSLVVAVKSVKWQFLKKEKFGCCDKSPLRLVVAVKSMKCQCVKKEEEVSDEVKKEEEVSDVITKAGSLIGRVKTKLSKKSFNNGLAYVIMQWRKRLCFMNMTQDTSLDLKTKSHTFCSNSPVESMLRWL